GGAPRLAFLDLSAPKRNTMVLGAPFDVSTPWNPTFELNLPPSFWGRQAVERSRRLRFSADGHHLTVFDTKRVFLVDSVEKRILKVWPTGTVDEGLVEGSTYLTPPGFQGIRSYSL